MATITYPVSRRMETAFPPRWFRSEGKRRLEFWLDLLPEDTAIHQVEWERRRGMVRMRELGFSFNAIGKRYDCSAQHASRLLYKWKRNKSDRESSPAERWASYVPWYDLMEYRGNHLPSETDWTLEQNARQTAMMGSDITAVVFT